LAAIIKTDQLWLDQTTSSTVGAPAIIFGADSLSGPYRIGTNNIGLTINGTKLLDMSSGAVAITGTLSATGLISPAQTVGIVGTTTNNSVQTGSIGEYVESDIAPGSGVSMTSVNPITLTSISLTAGDWDVSGVVQYVNPGPTTIAYIQACLSTVNNTIQNIYKQGSAISWGSNILPGADIGSPTPIFRYSIASTTTIYLIANASFAVSTLKAAGLLRARRVR
jgi:hypothetical protein